MSGQPEITRVVEDYVAQIWRAGERPGGEPATTDLAERLGVTPSTVSANLRRLARGGFILYEPYGRIELTVAGRAVAIRTLRRHRIVETYLVSCLGFGWDEVHTEADRLEHAVSDVLLDRMDAAVGFPDSDPHGDPIPSREGVWPPLRGRPLAECVVGETVRILRVIDQSPEALRFFTDSGLTIGAAITLCEYEPVVGTLTVSVADAVVRVSVQRCAEILVESVSI